MNRRSFFPAVAALAGSAAAPAQTVRRKGRLKQGATRGCFGRGMSFPEICKQARRLGLTGIDLIGPADWPVMKENGLIPTMAPSASTIRDGINRVENHAKILEGMRQSINQAAAAGVPNVIVLSGERKGLPDEQGIENSVKFFNQIKGLAEDKGVTLCLELLNSKVNHPDYQCDHTKWGVEVCKRVGSPAGETALRHLPHADYGRRHHPHPQGQHPVDRSLPYRGATRGGTSRMRARS